jgi:phage terminase small subunit
MRTLETRAKIAALGLTEMQKMLCEEYVKDFDYRRAHLAAGYSPKILKRFDTKKNFVEHPMMSQYVEILTKETLERVHLDPDKVIKERMAIAFSRLGNFVEIKTQKVKKLTVRTVVVKDLKQLSDEDAACIQEISETQQGIKIKLHSKNEALTALEAMIKRDDLKDKPTVPKKQLSVLILADSEARQAADMLFDKSLRLPKMLAGKVHDLVSEG